MKKTLFVLSLMFYSISFSYADEISLLADEWCPYNCVPGSKKPGYLIEIARTIFTKAGHTVAYFKQPWGRALRMVREGKYNAVIAASVADAPDFIFPKHDQGMLSYSFFTKKESQWRYLNIESLYEQSLGVVKDYAYSEALDRYIENNMLNNRIQMVYGKEGLTQNINKLLYGRVTTLISDELAVNYFLSKVSKQQLLINAGFLMSKTIYIAFSPNNSKSNEYAQILSDGMTELRSSGELSQIMAKYGLVDWQKESVVMPEALARMQ